MLVRYKLYFYFSKRKLESSIFFPWNHCTKSLWLVFLEPGQAHQWESHSPCFPRNGNSNGEVLLSARNNFCRNIRLLLHRGIVDKVDSRPLRFWNWNIWVKINNSKSWKVKLSEHGKFQVFVLCLFLQWNISHLLQRILVPIFLHLIHWSKSIVYELSPTYTIKLNSSELRYIWWRCCIVKHNVLYVMKSLYGETYRVL